MTSPSDGPIYGGMTGRAPSETPPPVNQIPDIDAQVKAIVEAQLAEVEAKYQDRIAALESQLKNVGPPVTAYTEHAAGPGYDVAETWSMAEQEASRAA